ncbi:MAG: fumarate hydratase C-terminal domain-containing protein [bacterium]
MNIRHQDIDKTNLHLLKDVKAGEWITYTGDIITVRDSSQIKLFEMYIEGKKLPVDLNGSIVMYGAPTEGKQIIIGPTTSIRMDASLDFMLGQGVLATIGKGARSDKAKETIKRNKTPYLVLMSGVSAYLSKFFITGEIIAFSELGPEAVRKFTTSKLPLLVAIDPQGESIF